MLRLSRLLSVVTLLLLTSTGAPAHAAPAAQDGDAQPQQEATGVVPINQEPSPGATQAAPPNETPQSAPTIPMTPVQTDATAQTTATVQLAPPPTQGPTLMDTPTPRPARAGTPAPAETAVREVEDPEDSGAESEPEEAGAETATEGGAGITGILVAGVVALVVALGLGLVLLRN
jgi:hypothetical protein